MLTWLKRAAYLLSRPGGAPARAWCAAGDAHWWHVSTFRRAVVTDMSEQGLRVRTRDRALALALARRGARSLARLATEGPKVAARVPGGDGVLTSRENWARLYGIDGPEGPDRPLCRQLIDEPERDRTGPSSARRTDSCGGRPRLGGALLLPDGAETAMTRL